MNKFEITDSSKFCPFITEHQKHNFIRYCKDRYFIIKKDNSLVLSKLSFFNYEGKTLSQEKNFPDLDEVTSIFSSFFKKLIQKKFMLRTHSTAHLSINENLFTKEDIKRLEDINFWKKSKFKIEDYNIIKATKLINL